MDVHIDEVVEKDSGEDCVDIKLEESFVLESDSVAPQCLLVDRVEALVCVDQSEDKVSYSYDMELETLIKPETGFADSFSLSRPESGSHDSIQVSL